MCERWVGNGTDCNILTPIPLTIASLLPHSAGLLNQSPEGPSPLSETGSHCLELQLKLQLTQVVCGTWLYNCLTFTCFLWASQLHRIQPVHRSRWYPDIFDRMHPFLDWRLGRGPIFYMRSFSKKDLKVLAHDGVLNNLHWLICNKTKPKLKYIK